MIIYQVTRCVYLCRFEFFSEEDNANFIQYIDSSAFPPDFKAVGKAAPSHNVIPQQSYFHCGKNALLVNLNTPSAAARMGNKNPEQCSSYAQLYVEAVNKHRKSAMVRPPQTKE